MKPVSAADLSDGVLAVSDDLSAKLTTALSRAASEATKSIAVDLRSGRFEEAKTAARELEFTEALTKSEKTIRRFTQASALVGASAVDRPQTSVMVQAGFPHEIDVSSVRLMQNMINRQLTRETRRRLLARISQAERFQKAEPIDPDKLAKDINRYLRGEIRRVVDVSSNIVGTRVSAYGMLHEARARGISRYRIDAVLDDRTTDICRQMDGRQFSVEQAYTRTQHLLSLTDPAALKDAAPFPDLETVTTKGSDYLQNVGIDTPPFHFLCRSVVTLIGTDTEYPPVPISALPDTPKPMSAGQRKAFQDAQDHRTRAALGMKAGDSFEDLYDEAFDAIDIDSADETLNRAVTVQAYAGNVYSSINETLRRHVVWRADEHREMARKLDDMFDRAPATTEDTVLYRGVGSTVIRELDQVGKVFQDDGFMSTTFNASLPPQFHRDGGGLLQILLPKGMSGLDISKLSQLSAEDEFLLPRGMQMRVVGFKKAVIDDEEVTMIRVVIQGTGRRIDLDNIKDFDTAYESVIKGATDDRWKDKFSYKSGDLREATTAG